MTKKRLSNTIEGLIKACVKDVLTVILHSNFSDLERDSNFISDDSGEENELPPNHPKFKILSFLLKKERDGASMGDIMSATRLNRGQVKRHMMELRASGDIRMVGQRRNSLYFPG